MNAFRRIPSINNTQILILLFVIAFIASFGSAWVNVADAASTWWSGWLQNFSTEMLGAIVTFWFFDVIVGGRRRHEEQTQIEALRHAEKLAAEKAENQRLIIQMRSRNNATAITAVEQLRANGGLRGGSLNGANLRDAYLQRANLRDANLQGAFLDNAKLQGAFLIDAKLEDANLVLTQFDEKTVLPDAKRQRDEKGRPIYNKYWTPETDMSRYTDPKHPHFWQPDWVKEQEE